MKQYEYKSVPFSGVNLSVEGMQGWNLCVLTQDGTAIFNREILPLKIDLDPDIFEGYTWFGSAPVDHDTVN